MDLSQFLASCSPNNDFIPQKYSLPHQKKQRRGKDPAGAVFILG